MSDLGGALAVLGAFHHNGLHALGLNDRFNARCGERLDDEASAIAIRLVSWHFRHQSRARAQLARQDWVDKAYLCRSSAPTIGAFDERHTAWLVETLVEHGSPGWAVEAVMFMTGALEIPHGPAIAEKVRAVMTVIQSGDVAAVAAVCTYPEVAIGLLGDEVRRWAELPANRDGVIDALVAGVVIDDEVVRPPRFLFASAPEMVFDAVGLRFARLAQHVNVVPLTGLASQVRRAVAELVRAGRVDVDVGAELDHRVEAGDLRPLDDAVAASGGGRVMLDDLVEQACLALAELRST
jgi:hypothetical protein